MYFMSFTGQKHEWSEIISKSTKVDQTVTKFLLINMITTCSLYVLAPMTKDIIYFHVYDIERSCNMPFSSEFFYDIKKSPACEITYFLSGWTVYISTLTHVSYFFIVKSGFI